MLIREFVIGLVKPIYLPIMKTIMNQMIAVTGLGLPKRLPYLVGIMYILGWPKQMVLLTL